jgi:phosphoserine aminotransferase
MAAKKFEILVLNQISPAGLKRRGGLAEIEKRNIAKAKLLYDFLDASAFFKSPVRKQDRSRMNIPFKLAKEDLNEAFLKGAKERGMLELKGHRAVSGMRASIYNAMPIEGVRHLVEYIARVRGEARLKTGDGPERQLLAESGCPCRL